MWPVSLITGAGTTEIVTVNARKNPWTMTAETMFQPGKQHILMRAANRVGGVLERLHFRPKELDEERLLARARRNAKWDDFGSEDIREPLRALVDAVNRSHHLTPVGRDLLRKSIIAALGVRLRVHQAIARHPEILDQPVQRPLIIMGLPRTGTTLLNMLLSQDPASRPLLAWEALCPVPLPRVWGMRDPRVQLTAAMIWWMQHVGAPEASVMHPFAHDAPDECHWLMWRALIAPPFIGMSNYGEWLGAQPDEIYDIPYMEYRRELQALHYFAPSQKHWVLKSPLHSWALPSLMRIVPEACIVQTHRVGHEVLPSICSLGAVLTRIFADDVSQETVGSIALDIVSEGLERNTRGREVIDSSRACDLKYTDLVADPIGAVRKVYDDLDYEYTPRFEARLQSYIADTTREPRPKHRYTLEQFGLTREAVDEAFDSYHRQYGLV